MEMKENKYYKPSIEEFCIGFECEVNWNKAYEKDFKPLLIDVKNETGAYTNTLGDIINAYDDGYAEFRVKILDSQDIEDLGWTHVRIYDNESLGFQKFIDDSDDFYELCKDIDSEVITIELWKRNVKGSHDCFTLFKGKIKNKNELSKLMQMLNIK